MPKVSRKAVSVSNLRSTPLSSTKELLSSKKNNTNENTNTQTSAPSRGQRKRQAKREQYLKREKMIMSTLKLQKMEDQKKRIDGLDAIKEALVQTMKANQERELERKEEEEKANSNSDVILKSNKSKKDIAQKEITHLNLVLQHPSFKSNPFATMQQHLKNTLADQAKEQEVVARKERSEEETKNKEKKELKKERIRNAKYEKGRKQRRRRN
jgi:hypothetical protein